jgi:hypothetical protein
MRCRRQRRRKLVLAGWKYALRLLDQRQKAAEDKLRWARERSDWLEIDAAADGVVDLADNAGRVLASDESEGLASRFLDLVHARRHVDKVVILSPYWDEDLSALEGLQNVGCSAGRPRLGVPRLRAKD